MISSVTLAARAQPPPPNIGGGDVRRLRGPGGADDPADVIAPGGGRVPGVRAAVTREVADVVVVPDEMVGVIDRREGIALAVQAALGTEGGVLAEERAPVVRLGVELEIL